MVFIGKIEICVILRIFIRNNLCQKDRPHSKTMTEKRLDKQTIWFKRTELKANRELLLGYVTEKTEIAYISYFLKFHLAGLQTEHLQAAQAHAQNQACKKKIFPTHYQNYSYICQILTSQKDNNGKSIRRKNQDT